MLPSRLLRNARIPLALRNLITPKPPLLPTVSVQLRLRLGILPNTHNNAYSTNKSATSPSSSKTNGLSSPNLPPRSSTTAPEITTLQPLPEKLEPRLSITFTCTVPSCGERSTHQFTKRAYERGIVLVQCPGCKNRHLIADHLGWFKDSTDGGKLRTVEDILREKGEKIRRGRIDASGVVEYTDV